MAATASGSIVNKWMLEFAICDLKDDRLIKKMLSAAPALKDDVGLKKIILLRAIESEVADNSVSEKTLDTLEMAFELDRQAGFDILVSMKTAYCLVAIDCVARFAKSMSEVDEYVGAVKRIWRKRIRRLRKHNVDLFPEQLEIWMDTIESAVSDVKLRGKLLVKNTRCEAVVAVKRYLVEAWDTVGPKFTSGKLGKSVVEAQLLCLQKYRETSKGKPLQSFNTPHGLGDSSNPTAQYGGKVLRGQPDPSSLVSSPLLKNKDREHLADVPTRNPTGTIPDERSNPALNLKHGENVILEVNGSPKEQNLLQTSWGLTPDLAENIEYVHDKGGGRDVVNEHVADLPSSASHANSQYTDDLKAHEATYKVGVRRKHVAGPFKLSKRVRINDSEDVEPEGSNRQHNHLLSEVEVIKIHEEFKSSSRELQDVVKDPLPDALHVAEAVLSHLSINSVPHTPAKSISKTQTLDVEDGKGNDEESTSCKNNVRTTSMERGTMNLRTDQVYKTNPIDVSNNEASPIAVGNGKDDLQNENSGHENRQRRTTLWGRNASTRTFEWDNSVDGSPKENFRLPTPKNCVGSPLMKYECPKFARRRPVKKWSVVEENTLRDGVQRFGRGNWKMILNAYRDIFEDRTEVDLKDKWRRMIH